MEIESLWLPDEYGVGTIVYDKKGAPWVAKKKLMDGAGIFEMQPVPPVVAKEMVEKGAKELKSS